MAKNSLAYSKKHIEWLMKNSNKYNSYKKIAQDFNKNFKTNKSVNALQQFITKKLGIYLVTNRKMSHYTQEEVGWLIDNHKKYDTFAELTKGLNKEFNGNRKICSVKEKCNKQLGIKMGNPTVYKKGNKKEQLPIGTIRRSTNGCTYIKVMDSAYSYQSGYREPYWLPIQKKIWMDHHGSVPDGKMVIFLDGNKNNLDVSNLYCIDRKISAIMASNGWYCKDGEITFTAIKWCELFYALKAN